jgi:excisionase family DNA binding protein
VSATKRRFETTMSKGSKSGVLEMCERSFDVGLQPGPDTERFREAITALCWAYAPCDEKTVVEVLYDVAVDILERHEVWHRKSDTDEDTLRRWIRQTYRHTMALHTTNKRKINAAHRSLVAVGGGQHHQGDHRPTVLEDEILHPEELSTEDAATILRVSRPYVVKLIENGVLPARKVGRYRRIATKDLMAYREKAFEQSMTACTGLTRLVQAETDVRGSSERSIDAS